MSYLLLSDYNLSIQSGELNQITTNDNTIAPAALAFATTLARSKLIQKYDLNFEFRDWINWTNSLTFNAGDRVYTGSLLYQANYPYPLFDQVNGNYLVGDQVYWKGYVYTCLVATSNIDEFTAMQYIEYNQVPSNNIFPDDINVGASYWGSKTAYIVPANTALTNTTYFTPGDTRNPLLVNYLIDIALFRMHYRISPRNIPEFRVEAYDKALHWLENCKKGIDSVELPLIQPVQGSRIRYGGKVKTINDY